MSGLRERKKSATRVALSWAAVRLVVERGYDAVRVEDIAAAADVSVRTFRNYFPTKADAIAFRHRERVEQLADALRARPVDEPLWDAVRSAVQERFALGVETDGAPPDRQWIDGVRVMVEEPALAGALQKAVAGAQTALAEAVAARTGTDPRRDLYPTLVAAAVGAVVSSASELWLRADPPVPFAPLLQEGFDRLTAGLPPTSGSTS
ncbi:acyl-CoA-like ligand-binding transcription factor [Pseudonocardia dioxanivorans]|uniref:acyl-CoA-like ligand-binding transcription factor n=1 Tax=Pseudonocardia dioxanivorans TaxID=240495 RepID=UPI000CD04C83|nr:TetR family transcriptional regulator [Pseudonocardia dioxanivorans]